MNKLEEAKDFAKKRYGSFIDISNNDWYQLMADFAQQNTLTLDSKIKDGEPMKPPKINEVMTGMTINYRDEYEKAPTLRECLKELSASKGFEDEAVITQQALEIEQLTKERDELKKYSNFPLYDIYEQLQAEKQKVKVYEDMTEDLISLLKDAEYHKSQKDALKLIIERLKLLNQ